MKGSHEIDMTHGPVFSKILFFTIPLMFTGIFQLLFNAADVIVVGKFAGSISLAAVGSTAPLINLLVNVFIAISTGANVLAARFFGSRNEAELDRCVHCTFAFSGILGLIVAIFGFFLSTPLLVLMNTDPTVLPLAALYLKIYFLGVPANIVFNFGAALLRALGDTNRPLRFLVLSGVVNVLLNLLTVIVFSMGVAGVAIATAVSQYVAAGLVVRFLMHTRSSCNLRPKDIRIHWDLLRWILQIGLPAALQSSIFCLSNVVIQSAINSFGYVVMAGNSAACNLDSFIYNGMNASYHAALCFTSQNMGAKKYERLNRVLFSCLVIVMAIGFTMSGLIYGFGPQLLSLYVPASDPQRDAVLAAGMVRLTYVALPYFLCGIMEVGTGALRGMGKSWTPLIISVTGACIFRILWVQWIFPLHPTLPLLYLSWPLSWFFTPLALYLALWLTRRQLRRRENLSPV